MWMLLRTNGQAQVYVNGVSRKLGETATGTIDTSTQQTLELVYNPVSNTLSASAGGTAILTDFDLDDIFFEPDITDAGFMMNKQSTDARVDNFELVVPEPGSLVLIGLGGLPLLARPKSRG